MAHKFYTGAPTFLPGNSPAANQYNEARKKIDVEFLGDFLYSYNFPMAAKNSEVGKKYPAKGEKCQFGFWKVTNKGEYIERNRPGESKVLSLTGKEYLVSYVVTPRMCSDTKVDELSHPAFYTKGYEYQDIVDPGAVALATNGKGFVREIASNMVDECTADVKNSLKIGTTSKDLPGETVFTGFANANHCDTMTRVILRSSFPEVFADHPGELRSTPFDPTLNADLYLRYDLPSSYPSQE